MYTICKLWDKYFGKEKKNEEQEEKELAENVIQINPLVDRKKHNKRILKQYNLKGK